MAFQQFSFPMPLGDMTPKPVTTTRLFMKSTPLITNDQETNPKQIPNPNHQRSNKQQRYLIIES